MLLIIINMIIMHHHLVLLFLLLFIPLNIIRSFIFTKNRIRLIQLKTKCKIYTTERDWLGLNTDDRKFKMPRRYAKL